MNRYKYKTSTLQCILLAISMLLVFPVSATEKNLWFSSVANIWKSENHKTKLSLYGEARASIEVDEYNGFFLGPIIRHQLNKYINIGGAYKFINLKDNQGTYKNLNRFELEITPSLSFGEYKVGMRSRIEVIKDDGQDDKIRLRHRLQFSKALSGNTIIKSIFMKHEMIYIYKSGQSDLNQYRFIPIGIKWKISNHVFSTNFMIKRKNNSEGTTSYILGVNYLF
jgi:hypothetical protein